MTPSLTALDNPDAYPAAAAARLLATSAALVVAAQQHPHAPWLRVLARVASRAAPLITLAVQDTATDAEQAALATAAKLGTVATAWGDEWARRGGGQAMPIARLARHLWADVALPLREFVPAALAPTVTAPPIRILAGADAVVAALQADPLTDGPAWDLAAQAAILAAWVQVA